MVLGTETVLKIRGRGPAVVKQVYDNPDLVKVLHLALTHDTHKHDTHTHDTYTYTPR